MSYTEKEYKKLNQSNKKNHSIEKKESIKKEENLPAWFHENHDLQETSEEEVEELDKILNELI